MATTEQPGKQDRPTTVAISDAIVRIVRKHTGRGPTRARTEISDQLITCVLGDSLTVGERTLAERGREQHVLRTREEFQRAMGGELIAAVQEISNRRVAAYMSANHIDPDLGIEAFVLEPHSGSPVDDTP